jgi:hypothetical protein
MVGSDLPMITGVVVLLLFRGTHESISIKFFKHGWKIPSSADNSENFDAIFKDSVKDK